MAPDGDITSGKVSVNDLLFRDEISTPLFECLRFFNDWIRCDFELHKNGTKT